MSLLVKRNLIPSFNLVCRGYCKSIYEKEEEGSKPRMVHGKPYPDWRKPWIERDGEFKTKFSLFNLKNPSPDIMNALQNLPNIDINSVKKWWQEMKIVQQVQNQKFLPERVAALGSNLAALHFFTYRSCAVRLKDSPNWICGNFLTLNLPDRFVEGYFIESIDCTDFHHGGLRYEGVQNFSGLNFLKWLSLKNNKHIDVWCLDRIAGQNGKSLEYLDISGCNLTMECIYAIARMEALKVLIVTEPEQDIEMQAALSILELERPDIIMKCVEPAANRDVHTLKQ